MTSPGLPVNRVCTGDAVKLLGRLPICSVDLVFADPPFNIGYHYDLYNDRLSRQRYLNWLELWIPKLKNVLKPEGSLFIAIGDEYAADYKLALDRAGFTLRNWIIWHYTFGVNCRKKFNRSHAHILYYTNHPKRFTFNADPVRVPSARLTTYADPRANPAGKIPDDTWVLRPQDSAEHFRADGDTWAMPRICGTFKERTGHPCQMPEAVLDRVIRVASNPGDLVLDPFAGSGTTLAVAKKLGREYLGFELSKQYAEGARQRLQAIPAIKQRKVS